MSDDQATVQGVRKVWDPRIGPREDQAAWVEPKNRALVDLDMLERTGGATDVEVEAAKAQADWYEEDEREQERLAGEAGRPQQEGD